MQLSELLRKLADLIDQADNVAAGHEGVAEPEAETGEIAVTHLEPVEQNCVDDSEPASMVSPLQQEHELLKKSQGVDNHVAEFAEDDDELDLSMDIEETPNKKPDFLDIDKDGDREEPMSKAVKDKEVEEDVIDGEEVDYGYPWQRRNRSEREDPEAYAHATGDISSEEEDDELEALRKMAGIGESQGPYNYAEDLKPASINPRAEAARQFHAKRIANSK